MVNAQIFSKHKAIRYHRYLRIHSSSPHRLHAFASCPIHFSFAQICLLIQIYYRHYSSSPHRHHAIPSCPIHSLLAQSYPLAQFYFRPFASSHARLLVFFHSSSPYRNTHLYRVQFTHYLHKAIR